MESKKSWVRPETVALSDMEPAWGACEDGSSGDTFCGSGNRATNGSCANGNHPYGNLLCFSGIYKV